MRSGSVWERLLQGVREVITSDAKRREVLFLVLNIALALTSLIMLVVNVFTREYILLAVMLSFGAACLLNALILHFTRRVPRVIHILFGAEVTVLRHHGDPERIQRAVGLPDPEFCSACAWVPARQHGCTAGVLRYGVSVLGTGGQDAFAISLHGGIFAAVSIPVSLHLFYFVSH